MEKSSESEVSSFNDDSPRQSKLIKERSIVISTSRFDSRTNLECQDSLKPNSQLRKGARISSTPSHFKIASNTLGGFSNGLFSPQIKAKEKNVKSRMSRRIEKFSHKDEQQNQFQDQLQQQFL